jgi:hypothetical protein
MWTTLKDGAIWKVVIMRTTLEGPVGGEVGIRGGGSEFAEGSSATTSSMGCVISGVMIGCGGAEAEDIVINAMSYSEV